MKLSMFTDSLGDLQVRAHSIHDGTFVQCARRPVLIQKGFLFIEYHVDNGFLIKKPDHRHHLEKIRVLAFHGLP